MFSKIESIGVVTANCGKVAFVYSGTVLRYYIGQTFLAMFRSDLYLFRHTTTGTLIKMQGTNNTNGVLYILNL